MTTVQDYPGRLGYWHVGVPPSGPMDSLSFRIGNQLLGNEEGAPGLEVTVTGPTLKFHYDTEIAVTGADFGVERWKVIPVQTGFVLQMGECVGPGARAYILFRGGLDVPMYLGSASTFTLGKFGGHAGRASAHRRRLALWGRRSRLPGNAGMGRRKRLPHILGDRSGLRPPRRPRLLHPRRHRSLLLRRLEGPLQLQPHRRPPDRPQTRMGAPRRRRSRTASVEHPRQRLRHRRHRFHRRHARHPRPRRPQPRRLRLSRRHFTRRTLEDGPAQPRRYGSFCKTVR